MLNDASLALMTSLGHQLGLFDVLAALPPGDQTRDRRRRWAPGALCARVAGPLTIARVVEYDPGSGTYSLPPEHAGSLTRAARPANLAATTQYIPLLPAWSRMWPSASRRRWCPVLGVHRVPPADGRGQRAVHDAALVDSIVPLFEGLRERLRDGIEVADVGCGSGHAVNLLARAFPNSRFFGYDFASRGHGRGRHRRPGCKSTFPGRSFAH